MAATALRTGDLRISPDVRRLRSSEGRLMGDGGDGVPFALVAPVDRVLESQTPTLSWKPLAGAEKYSIQIFDEQFNQVAAGETNGTSWRPAKPLERGRVYKWQVSSTVDGKEVRSPVRPAPDAEFKVIDPASADHIAAARRANSHLLLGLAYADAGMVANAEAEFSTLVKQNPTSTIARRLLDQVRSKR